MNEEEATKQVLRLMKEPDDLCRYLEVDEFGIFCLKSGYAENSRENGVLVPTENDVAKEVIESAKRLTFCWGN